MEKTIITNDKGHGNLITLELETVILQCRESQVIRNKSLESINNLREGTLFVWNLIEGNKLAFYPNEGIFYLIDEENLKSFDKKLINHYCW